MSFVRSHRVQTECDFFFSIAKSMIIRCQMSRLHNEAKSNRSKIVDEKCTFYNFFQK